MNNRQTAAEIMENLMEEGIYPNMRSLRNQDKVIKKTLQKRLQDSEIKRHEFKKQGVVAKFVPKRISKIDYEGLNQFLFNLGLLVPIIEIDHKRIKSNLFLYDLLSSFQYESTYYVKPNFNKLGNSMNKPKEFSVDHLDEQMLTSVYMRMQPELHEFENIYEQARRRMFNCQELRNNRKLTHKYGSVSLIENDPLYDVESIYSEMGEELLIKYGKPDSRKIQKYIERGLLNKYDLERFKSLVDVRLDFVVMPLEAERKMINHLNQTQLKTALNQL